jgi:diaminohydroxyphosphoribosylaminopyrimidine deaminase/5-amino-6-(5-phosphoribosylamino)uracil reductase
VSDERYMALAISLGRRNLGQTAPNPSVGCVIVKNDVIVGRGYTAPNGRPHAETQALEQAGSAAKGATAYITLEPCSHEGKTPPCAHALVKAGIKRAVIAAIDPDMRVNGKGISILEAAGIEVKVGVLSDQASLDNAGFFYSQVKCRPWITLKLAASIDGKIATSRGDSKWITGSSARHFVHNIRRKHDAIMVGSGTVISDDPSLNVRVLGACIQPYRIVLSSNLEIPVKSNLTKTIREQPVWIFHSNKASEERKNEWLEVGADLFECKVDNFGISIKDVMQNLSDKGITRLLCEGGGKLAASLIRSELVDEIATFHGGLTIGSDGLPSIANLGVCSLNEAKRWQLVHTQSFGTEVLNMWRPTDKYIEN